MIQQAEIDDPTEPFDGAPRDYEIDELVQRVAEAEGAKLEAEEELAKAKAALLAAVMARGDGSQYGYTAEGEVLKVTVVAPERTKYDADALAAKIGKRAYNRLTKRVLDRVLIEQAVVDGSLPIETLAEVATVVPTKPYLLITRVDG